MRRPARVLLAIAAAATLATGSALAEETSSVALPTAEATETPTETPSEPAGPVFTEQRVYFHQAATKAGNLGAMGADSLPSWNTTAPGSVTTGAGGGYLGNIATEIALGDHTAESGPTFEGKFTGLIDSMAVDLYAFANPNDVKQGIRVQVLVDGELVHEDADPFDVAYKPGGQAARQINFAITGIHSVMELYGMNTAPDAEHTVRINVVPYYVGDDAMYVYDAAEAPSGITFNAAAEKLANYVVVLANG